MYLKPENIEITLFDKVTQKRTRAFLCDLIKNVEQVEELYLDDCKDEIEELTTERNDIEQALDDATEKISCLEKEIQELKDDHDERMR
jgi:polyhydroxyalkanoate synthesis regulator phasin